MELASRGQRDSGQGPEDIEDPEYLRQVKERARTVYINASIAAAMAAVLTLFLPM